MSSRRRQQATTAVHIDVCALQCDMASSRSFISFDRSGILPSRHYDSSPFNPGALLFSLTGRGCCLRGARTSLSSLNVAAAEQEQEQGQELVVQRRRCPTRWWCKRCSTTCRLVSKTRTHLLTLKTKQSASSLILNCLARLEPRRCTQGGRCWSAQTSSTQSVTTPSPSHSLWISLTARPLMSCAPPLPHPIREGRRTLISVLPRVLSRVLSVRWQAGPFMLTCDISMALHTDQVNNVPKACSQSSYVTPMTHPPRF